MFFLISIFFTGYIYEDSDSLLVLNDSLIICGYHQYNLKVHLANNARLKVRPWNGFDSTGKLIFHAPLIYIHNAMIEGTGKGFSGGTNTHPNGYGPGFGYAGISGGGGGGGYGGAGGDAAAGGGGGGGGGRIKFFYTFLDTVSISLSVAKGIGGYGGYGNGEDGQPGTIYFGQIVMVEELAGKDFSGPYISSVITSGRFMLGLSQVHSPILIFDSRGRLVNKLIECHPFVDVSELTSGIYFIKMDKRRFKKFILIK